MARKSALPPVSPPSNESRAALFELVGHASEPVEDKKLAKALPAALKMTEADLREVLDQAVRGGRLFVYPPKSAKGGPRYWNRDVAQLMLAALRADLAVFDEPQPPATVVKRTKLAVKVTEADAAQALEELVAEGTLFRHPPATAAGKPRYATRSPEQYRSEALLAALSKSAPVPETKFKSLLKGVPADELRSLVDRLLAGRQLFAHPPLGKTGKTLYGTRPPMPEDYLKEVESQLARVVGNLVSAGVSLQDLRRAVVQTVERAGVAFGGARPAASDSVPELLALMRQLDPGAEGGSLVSARDLRRAAGCDKRTLDEAVLALSREGKLALHRHDHVASLSPNERDDLVTDGAGNYYVGVAIRRSGS